MKTVKINGVEYASQKEVRDALISLRKDANYALEWKAGERYRIPGANNLCFNSVGEAVQMFRELKREAKDRASAVSPAMELDRHGCFAMGF